VVNSVTVSPDNALIVSASEDSTIFIWDFKTGEQVNKLKGHGEGVKTVSFSPDNKYLLSASMWGSVRLWDIQTGENIWEAPHHETLKIYGDYYINAINVTFSSDSRYAIAAFDKLINIRDVKTGKLIQTIIGHYNSNLSDPFGSVNSVYSNRNYLTAGVKVNISSNPYDPLFLDLIKIWDIKSGELIQTFSGLNRINPEVVSISESGIEWPEKSNLTAFTISPDNKLLVYGDDKGSICLMDISCGIETLSFLDREMPINTSLAFDLDNNTIINGTTEGHVKSWNLNYNEIRTYFSGNLPIESVSVTPDGRYFLVFDHNRIIKLFNSQSREQDPFNYLSIQPDYRQDIPDIAKSNNSLIGELGSYGIKIFDIKSSKIITELKPVDYADIYYNTFSLLHFCKDDKHLIIGDAINNGILIVDLDKGLTYQDFVYDLIFGNLKTDSIKYFARIDTLRPAREISSNNIQTGSGYPTSAVYNTGDGIVAVGYSDGIIILWNIENGNKIKTIIHHTSQVVSLAFDSDHDYLASVSSEGTIIVTDLIKEGKVCELKGTENIKIDLYGNYSVNNSPIDFIYNDKYIIAKGSDFDLRLWDAQTGDEIAKMMIPGQNDWIVSTPDGLFDASVNGMKYLYYVSGLEVIELDQMKDRYYEPGLLQKLLGFNEEPIRDVSAFNQVALYPGIELKEIDKNGNLDIHLTNNGGGIGQVKIFINGKEIASDARGNNADPNASHLTITEKIKDHPYLISGEDNVIEVKAYNAEGYLVSRGVKVKYIPEEKDQVEYPNLFIVAAGVSDYTGTDIDLKYAAKDASDIARAFGVGAKRLFGTDKTFTYLLTTDQNEDTLQPTKENLSRVFKEIAGKANSTDLLVVYISGHGINWGGQEGDFFYLTKEAYTASTNAYNDPAIREVSGISSEEMVDMIKKIPALKQVLIIDACASGKVIENLMAQRSVSSTTMRALDRMKDRTGMHIITGCTADAVSYEASRYGQGVLTYSLLEGIKGAALRDNRFVDISLLFQNARDKVPVLAEGIGGIQKPEVFSPYGSESFDIGELTTADKAMIPLAQIKPVFIRSSFQDEDEFDDVLKLSSIIDEQLNNISLEKNTFIYIDTREFPESYKLTGRYKQENGSIILQLRIRSKDSSEQFTIQGNSTDELIVKVLDIVQETDL